MYKITKDNYLKFVLKNCTWVNVLSYVMTLQVAPCQLSEVLLQLTQTFSHWWPGLMWQHCSLCFIRRWKKPKIPEYICKCLSSSVWLFHQVLHHAELLVFAMVLTLNVECGCEVVMPLGETLVCLSSLSWLFSTYMYAFIYICVCFNAVSNRISFCTFTANLIPSAAKPNSLPSTVSHMQPVASLSSLVC